MREGPAFGASVLIVDDEEAVLRTFQLTLQAEGIAKVVTERDSSKTLERIEAESPTVVLLDLTMPRLAGEQACRELHAIRADVPVLLLSGYSEQTASASFAGPDIAGYVQKPFSPTELSSRVGEVIRGRPRPNH
jgi:two-component system, cell cycle sensor histidine kinase and response regulator CckA